MLLVTSADPNQQNSMESGMVLMERQTARRASTSVTQLPESLHACANLAKDLSARCRGRALQLTDDEIQSITRDLENVILKLCDYLGRIPASAFGGNAFTNVATKSLSLRGHFEDVMSTNSVSNLPNRRSVHDSNIPRLVDFLRGMYHESHEFGGQTFNSLPEVSEYIEPLYDAFFCPLTNKVMTDPVTTQSGVTYERRAIEEHFERFADSSEPISCPISKLPLQSKTMTSNAPLKSVIAEWAMRNEAMRVRIARTALSLSTTDAMVLEAIDELKSLIKARGKNREQMHKIGVTKLLARLLDNHNVQIRCAALELLCLLVVDEEGKDIVGKTKAIARTIKLLSDNATDERHAAISFLLELSNSQLMLENIGSAAGSILILSTMRINDFDDPIAADKAGAVLKNLEKCSKNIKYMAECGYLDPLQCHLVDGSEEMQMEMVSYLSELVLEQELTIDISESTSGVLIKMVRSCNTVVRKAALDVLVQLSSHRPNSKTIVEAGVVPVMVEELFIRKVEDEPLSYKAKAATVLANVVESGIDPDTTVVNKEGHVLTSKYSIYNFVHMLKCFMPDDLNLSIIRVLLALTALAKPLAAVVSVIRENHRGHSIVELMNSPTEELRVSSTRLLIALAAHMGHTVAERLCKTQGQPGRLVKSIVHAGRVTELHAASATLLARLPYRDISLNLALVHKGAVPAILRGIEEMRRRGAARTSRHAVPYMEGLVGALVRLTATLYNAEVLKAAVDHDFASVLTELLAGAAGGGEVQRLAAVGLENLSYQSIKLSRPPPHDEPRPKKNTILKRLKDARVHNSKNPQLHVCPVHRGVCSPATTFCLLEAGAVDILLGFLESDDARVVEAALGALCTLVDERVDVEKSVAALAELGAARRVLGVLRQHRPENALWHKCFCVVEKLLAHGDDACVREVTGDRMLPTALVSAFHRGDASAKQAAESILRRLHKMPDYSATYVSMEF